MNKQVGHDSRYMVIFFTDFDNYRLWSIKDTFDQAIEAREEVLEKYQASRHNVLIVQEVNWSGTSL